MNIRCIIVDDEPLALKKLKRYILKYPFLELVSSCHNVETARRALESGEVNLIFIDINMPDVNGLEFIRTLENPPMVVFVTAYPEYAVESYRVNALDYLLKPFGTEEFNRVAEKIYNHWQLLQNHSNASATGEDNVRYLKIHQVSDNPFLTHMTFRQITDSFPDNFIHIHRSYVVNMKHVVSAERTLVILDDGTRLPVSSSRRNDLLNYMNTGFSNL